MFRNLKRKSDIDINVLQRMIEQDAPSVFGNGRFGSTKPNPDGVKFCAIGDESFAALQTAASLRELPDTVCVPDKELEKIWDTDGKMAALIGDSASAMDAESKCAGLKGYQQARCLCENTDSSSPTVWAPLGDDNPLSKITGSGECKCIDPTYNTWHSNLNACVNKNDATIEDVKNSQIEELASDKELLCKGHKDDGAVWIDASNTCDCSGIEDEDIKTACETIERRL